MTDILKATHQGELIISGKVLPCAVLENGERIIIQKSVFEAFERPARGQRARDKEINLPSFIAAKNLLPYINEDIREVINPIQYKDKDGKVKTGYKAEILPTMCDIYLSARKDNALTSHQARLGEISEIIVRALSKVGIVALVDEATGYQEVRDKKALAALLDKYLRKELAVWAKRFPDDFYKEMFRLRDWKWNPMTVARPSVVGRFTNDLVYERLAPNILEELEKRNPKNESGNRSHRHHQWLTEDIGNPALSQHIYALIALMKASTKWETFYRSVQRALPKKNETIPMLLED